MSVRIIKIFLVLDWAVAFGLYFARLQADPQNTLSIGTLDALQSIIGTMLLAITLLFFIGMIRPRWFSRPLGEKATRKYILGVALLAIFASLMQMGNLATLSQDVSAHQILAHAQFFAGEHAAPVLISVPDVSGRLRQERAFPGELVFLVDPGMREAGVDSFRSAVDGTIIGKIPAWGFYLFKVPPGTEAAALKTLTGRDGVIAVSLNLALETTADTAVINLADPTKNAADFLELLRSHVQAPGNIVMVQLDSFLGSTHGDRVREIAHTIAGDTPVVQLHVGGQTCGAAGGPCASIDQSVDALATVIAWAEEKGVKANINLSWGPRPSTTDPAQFARGGGLNANAWALANYETYFSSIAGVLQASAWARAGNVIVHKSAGNGVLLMDPTGTQVLAEGGVDLNPLLAKLRNTYPDAMQNIIYYGALNPDGTRAAYSNYGDGVVFAVVPPDARGTSFAAPQGWAAAEKAWSTNPDLPATYVSHSVQFATRQNSAGLAVLEPQNVEPLANQMQQQLKEGKKVEVQLPGANQQTVEKHLKITPPAPLPSGNGPLPVILTAPAALGTVKVGDRFSYSFCSPRPSGRLDLCGGVGVVTTNPTGGIPPYHFQLDTGIGFPPFGITLNLNGILEGTPTAAGESNFGVCAVDTGGFQDCAPVSVTVQAKEEIVPPPVPTPTPLPPVPIAPTPAPTPTPPPPPAKSCGPQPSAVACDQVTCAGKTKGYPSFDWENCYTPCNNAFINSLNAWNSCMGY